MLSFRVFEAFSKTKIDNIDIIFRNISSSNKEIVRFDITVDNSFFVNFLNSLNHLLGNQTDSFEVKFPFAL